MNQAQNEPLDVLSWIHDRLAKRWGDRTISRITRRATRDKSPEWIAIIYVAVDDAETKAHDAVCGVGMTPADAVNCLLERVEERFGAKDVGRYAAR